MPECCWKQVKSVPRLMPCLTERTVMTQEEVTCSEGAGLGHRGQPHVLTALASVSTRWTLRLGSWGSGRLTSACSSSLGLSGDSGIPPDDQSPTPNLCASGLPTPFQLLW